MYTMLAFDPHTIHAFLIITILGVQIAVAYLALRKYAETKDVPWLYMVLANSIFLVYAFFHALVVPDFIVFNDSLFDIFEHYGLFLGSVALFIGALLRTRKEEYLYRF